MNYTLNIITVLLNQVCFNIKVFFSRYWRNNRGWSFFLCLLSCLFYFSYLLSSEKLLPTYQAYVYMYRAAVSCPCLGRKANSRDACCIFSAPGPGSWSSKHLSHVRALCRRALYLLSAARYYLLSAANGSHFYFHSNRSMLGEQFNCFLQHGIRAVQC